MRYDSCNTAIYEAIRCQRFEVRAAKLESWRFFAGVRFLRLQ